MDRLKKITLHVFKFGKRKEDEAKEAEGGFIE